MFPFFESSKLSTPDSGPRRARSLQELTADMSPLYSLANHDTAMKFWLSEPAYDALAELADSQNVSKNEWLRGYFAMHCYGTYSITALLKNNPEIFKDVNSGIRYSLAFRSPPRGMVSQPTYFVPELGKNIAPVKVWLAEVQKKDLNTLAIHAKVTLSEYCREIITARILGHGTLPMRPEMLACSPNAAAQEWAADDKTQIPYREVGKAEYEATRFGYQDSKWVNAPDQEE
jgi:hypothetical protein